MNNQTAPASITRLRIVVAAFAILLGLAYAYHATRPAVYGSTASLLIDSEGVNSESDPAAHSDIVLAHRVLAESAPVRERAIALARKTLGEPATAQPGDFHARIDGVLLYLTVHDSNPARAQVYADAWSISVMTEIKNRSVGSAQVNSASTPTAAATSVLLWERASLPPPYTPPGWVQMLVMEGFCFAALLALSLAASRAWNRRKRIGVTHG